MKKALMISPSYHISDIDPRTLYVLQQVTRLTQDIKGYGQTGWQKDCAVMRSILGPTFQYVTLDGEVLARTLTTQLEWLLSGDTSIALLLFCGHGVNVPYRHDSMVCSFNQTFTATALDDVVKRLEFKGTFVRILNICEANGERAACHGVNAVDKMSRQSEDPRQSQQYNGLTIMASGEFEKTKDGQYGSRFMALLNKVFVDKVLVTYGNLEHYLNSATVRVLHTPERFTGTFGMPAQSIYI
jgi:Caspase domain